MVCIELAKTEQTLIIDALTYLKLNVQDEHTEAVLGNLILKMKGKPQRRGKEQ